MSYTLFILRRAQKDLSNLPENGYKRAKNAIFRLSDTPRPAGCAKLAGRDGWRIRVGNYRVIYDINDDAHTITVVHIGPRKDVYRSR